MTQLVRLAEFNDDSKLSNRLVGGAISIGNFDGVHSGHRELLRHVRRFADSVGGPSVAVVMDPHPASVLRPHGAPPTLTSLARRAELMSGVGVDYLLVCEATKTFLNQTAEAFFETLVVQTLRAKSVVEGPNFFFGRDRTGNVTRLRELCDEQNIQLTVVEPSVRDERMVSSSRVREAIAAGRIELANEMLGSNYQIGGTVTSGEGRGRKLGFPTANLQSISEMLPLHGVYGGIAKVNGSPDRIAAIHIGPNPTFDQDRKTKVEIHLLDYDGDLYGKNIVVELIQHVRDVEKFDGADALISQMNRDLRRIRDTIKPLIIETSRKNPA